MKFRIPKIPRRLFVIVLLGGVAEGAYAASRAKFDKNCEVLRQPLPTAEVNCTARRGSPAVIQRTARGYALVRTVNCNGYVPEACLIKSASNIGKRSESKAEVIEGTASQRRSGSSRIKLGVVSGFDGVWGKVAYSGTLSKGLGVSLGLDLKVPIGGYLRAILSPAFHLVRLGRAVDGSGALTDPTPTTYDQTVNYFGTTTLLGFLIEGNDSESVGEPEWWIEGGGEYLHPLSAKQAIKGGAESVITADKLFFIVLGPSIDLEFAPRWIFSGGLHLFYNVLSKEEGKIFGIRARLALNFSL